MVVVGGGEGGGRGTRGRDEKRPKHIPRHYHANCSQAGGFRNEKNSRNTSAQDDTSLARCWSRNMRWAGAIQETRGLRERAQRVEGPVASAAPTRTGRRAAREKGEEEEEGRKGRRREPPSSTTPRTGGPAAKEGRTPCKKVLTREGGVRHACRVGARGLGTGPNAKCGLIADWAESTGAADDDDDGGVLILRQAASVFFAAACQRRWGRLKCPGSFWSPRAGWPWPALLARWSCSRTSSCARRRGGGRCKRSARTGT